MQQEATSMTFHLLPSEMDIWGKLGAKVWASSSLGVDLNSALHS